MSSKSPNPFHLVNNLGKRKENAQAERIGPPKHPRRGHNPSDVAGTTGEDAYADAMRNPAPIPLNRKKTRKQGRDANVGDRRAPASEVDEIVDDSEDEANARRPQRSISSSSKPAVLVFTNANGPCGEEIHHPPERQSRQHMPGSFPNNDKDESPTPDPPLPTIPSSSSEGSDRLGRSSLVEPSVQEIFLEAREREITDLKSKLEAANGRITRLKENNKHLRTENANLKDTIGHLEKKLRSSSPPSGPSPSGATVATSSSTPSSKYTVEELQTTIRRIHAELTLTQENLSAALEAKERLAREASEAQKSSQRYKHRAASYRAEFTKTNDLLTIRTEELDIANAFMTTADRVSVADVSRLLGQLNDDIYQTAVSLSDAVLASMARGAAGSAMVKSELPRGLMAKARERIANKFGNAVVQALENEAAADESMLFEALVQNFLAYRCWSMIKRFYYQSIEIEKVLREMWEGVKSSSEPSIARNWLSMTSSQLKSQAPPDPTSTIQWLEAILIVAGYRPALDPQPHSASQTQPPPRPPAEHAAPPDKCILPAALYGLLLSKLADQAAKALQVKAYVTQDVLSTELEVTTHVVSSGLGKFSPLLMEDAYGFLGGKAGGDRGASHGSGASAGRGSGGKGDGAEGTSSSSSSLTRPQATEHRVVCATALGLVCRHPKRRAADGAGSTKNGQDDDANAADSTTRGEDSDPQRTETIMKCKVLLVATVEEEVERRKLEARDQLASGKQMEVKKDSGRQGGSKSRDKNQEFIYLD